MITSCNHSSTEKLCGSCREKNYRQSFLDEKDARIAELERKLVEAEEKINFLTIRKSRAMEFAAEKHSIISDLKRQLEDAKSDAEYYFNWVKDLHRQMREKCNH